MKRIAIGCLVLVAGLLLGQELGIWGNNQFSVINVSAVSPVALTNKSVYVPQVTILGKSAPRQANSGIVYISPRSADNIQAFPVSPDGQVILKAPAGYVIDLSKWYLDPVIANDGVTLIY